MPILTVRGPDGKEREVEVTSEMTIGRAEGNDLVLAEGGVSRRHARVFLKGGQLVVEDTGSANGTFIEGRKIEAPTVVPPGRTLQIGDYELKLKAGASGGGGASDPGVAIVKAGRPKTTSRPKLGDQPSAPSTRTLPKKVGRQPGDPPPPAPNGAPRGAPARPARAGRAPGPRVVRDVPDGPALVGASGLWVNQRFPIGAKAVVGRLPGVDIQLDDDSVSRRHAELEVTPRGVRLKDLNSANGTAVNGVPVEGAVTLQHGDAIQFGVVEVVYENEAEMAAQDAAAGGIKPRRSRMVLLVVVLLVAVVGGGVAAKVVLPKVNIATAPPQPVVEPVDPRAALQELLAQCRSFLETEQGEPNWARAEAACNKALDIDPIDPDAMALMKSIKAEQEAQAHYEKAVNLQARLRDEEALEEFGAIPSSSFYYLRTKPRLKEAVEKALVKTMEDCNLYVRNRDFKSALARCEAHLKLACQDMEKDDVTPPAGFTIRLTRGKLKEREWAPAKPAVVKYYQLREKVDPTLPPFKCEKMEILARGQQDESPETSVTRVVAARISDRTLANAVMLYWRGKAEDAVATLQRVRQDMRRTDTHAQAEQLMLDMNSVASLYKTGATFIQASEVEKAAERYREAMDTDTKLMGDTAQRWPSWYRDAISRDITDATLQQGRFWMQRNDRKAACKFWRMGFSFYQGNVELNRAIANQCSNKASDFFNQAQSCADLDDVLLYAVDGDGMKEKVQDRKQQWACP
jgi:pSer/pThr/pTyr-binding forkhead associated (FHA) protein/tetratricopeptide (TPR) repeat protein